MDEAAQATKDDLTLLVRQLHPKTGEFDVFELFSTAGKVVDVRLIMDERTQKCMGVGYVEMGDMAGLQAGLQLSGRAILGTSILVSCSFAEKNRMAQMGASAADIKAAGYAGAANMNQADGGVKLYVGGLDYHLAEANLREIFGAFGELERVELHRDEQGVSKGYAFLHFRKGEDGRRCIETMDGFELAGRPIRVSLSAVEQAAAVSAGAFIGGIPGAAPLVLNAGAQAGTGSTKQLDAQNVASLDSLDDGLAGGKLNAAQRSAIMARLAQNAGMDVPDETRKAASQTSVGSLTQDAAASSRCIILKNMFDRLSDEAQSNPNFFLELADDVRGECGKMGTVLHCAADKWSNGFVYVKMLAHTEAIRVSEVMNGRYFAKNKIIVSFIEELAYDKKMKLR